MRKIILMAAPMIAAASFYVSGVTPVQATANAPVCASLYTGMGQIDQCDFYNYQQCQATVSGIGGTCFDNPALKRAGTSPAGAKPRQRS